MGLVFHDSYASRFSWLTYLSGSGCWKIQTQMKPTQPGAFRSFSVSKRLLHNSSTTPSGYLDWLRIYSIRASKVYVKKEQARWMLYSSMSSPQKSYGITFTKWIEWSCHKTLPSFKGMEQSDLTLVSGRSIWNIVRGTFGMRCICSCSPLWNIQSATVVYLGKFHCRVSGQPEVHSQIRFHSYSGIPSLWASPWRTWVTIREESSQLKCGHRAFSTLQKHRAAAPCCPSLIFYGAYWSLTNPPKKSSDNNSLLKRV